MTSSEFEKLVQKAIDKIPPRFRREIRNLAFVVRREAPERGLLGLYVGRPLTERSISEAFPSPDVILIFQAPHERLAHDEVHLAKMVEDTVWHEVAHYFGLDEAEVQAAERKREAGQRRGARRRR